MSRTMRLGVTEVKRVMRHIRIGIAYLRSDLMIRITE